MSDWFATKSVAPAANGGLDLVMPAFHSPWGAALVAAVEAGEVAASRSSTTTYAGCCGWRSAWARSANRAPGPP